MTKYGYARVSTEDQTTETQTSQLLAQGVEQSYIFAENRSSRKDRPQLKALMAELKAGDELVVVKLDRLARSLSELQEIASELERRGVSLVFSGMTYNPNDPNSKVFFQLLGAFADFERSLIAQRTKDRLDALKAAGGKVGRKRSTTPEQEELIVKLLQSGYSNSELRKVTGLSNSVIYRVKREAEDAEREASDPQVRRARRELDTEAARAQARKQKRHGRELTKAQKKFQDLGVANHG